MLSSTASFHLALTALLLTPGAAGAHAEFNQAPNLKCGWYVLTAAFRCNNWNITYPKDANMNPSIVAPSVPTMNFFMKHTPRTGPPLGNQTFNHVMYDSLRVNHKRQFMYIMRKYNTSYLTPRTFDLSDREECEDFFKANISNTSVWFEKLTQSSYGTGVTPRYDILILTLT